VKFICLSEGTGAKGPTGEGSLECAQWQPSVFLGAKQVGFFLPVNKEGTNTRRTWDGSTVSRHQGKKGEPGEKPSKLIGPIGGDKKRERLKKTKRAPTTHSGGRKCFPV